MLQIFLRSLKDSDAIIDVHDVVKKTLNMDIAPIEELEHSDKRGDVDIIKEFLSNA